MFREVIACLDGSLFAEKILPYARGVAGPMGAKLTGTVGDRGHRFQAAAAPGSACLGPSSFSFHWTKPWRR